MGFHSSVHGKVDIDLGTKSGSPHGWGQVPCLSNVGFSNSAQFIPWIVPRTVTPWSVPEHITAQSSILGPWVLSSCHVYSIKAQTLCFCSVNTGLCAQSKGIHLGNAHLLKRFCQSIQKSGQSCIKTPSYLWLEILLQGSWTIMLKGISQTLENGAICLCPYMESILLKSRKYITWTWEGLYKKQEGWWRMWRRSKTMIQTWKCHVEICHFVHAHLIICKMGEDEAILYRVVPVQKR